jgi:hypothetical protein
MPRIKFAPLRCVALLASTTLFACAGADRIAGPDARTAKSVSPGSSPTSAVAGLPLPTTSPSVNGNVTLTAQPDPTQPAVVFTYSFSANEKLDVIFPSFVTGQFHFQFVFSNVHVSVDGSVACFFVIGNKARIAGVIGRTSDPILFPVASTMIWSVTDNDNILLPVALPAAAPAKTPDTASPLLRLPGVDPLTFCLAGGFLPELPVIRGQVSVSSD